jgi:hypothetical protein
MRWTNKTIHAAAVIGGEKAGRAVLCPPRRARSARPTSQERRLTTFPAATALLARVFHILGRAALPRRHAATGLLFLAAALAAPAADGTNSAPATLLLRNGDSMDGNLLSIDARQIVRWKHADVAEPVEFKLDSVSQLDLHPPAPPDRGTNHPCNVSLTQGDALEGSLVSCDRDSLLLQTWYAGQLSIPRKQVQSISFFPTTPDLFTAAGPDGWTQGAVTGVLGADAGQWTFRDGAFYAAKSASIARDIKLPDTAELQFDLAWSGDFGLSVALYTDSLQPMLIADKDKLPDFGAFYSMVFRSTIVQVARIKKMENLTYLSPVFIPAASQTNRVHIDVRACKKSNTLALAVDGQLLQAWNDTNGFIGQGTGVRFVHNGSGPVKVSNLRMAPWDGLLVTQRTNAPAPGQDAVWLTNGAALAGVMESLADGKLTLRTNTAAVPSARKDSPTNENETLPTQPDAMEVPLDGIARLTFAPQQAGRDRELPGTVHAIFAHGGPLAFQLESWTAEGVNLRSPVYGQARFDPNAFRRLVFAPPEAAAGAATNRATGLP